MRNAESIRIALDPKINYRLNPPPTDITDRCRSSPKRVLLHKLREVDNNVLDIPAYIHNLTFFVTGIMAC